MNQRLILVDGNSLINRAFYGLGGPALTLPDGTPIGAVMTFMNMLLKQIQSLNPKHLAVTFDTPHKTFRHEMDEDYKGTRKGMPDDLAVQMPQLKALLDHMGFYRIEMKGFEADDLIGTIATRYSEDGGEVYILSGDRDDLQLLNDKIRVVYPKGRGETVLYDPQIFEEEYGFAPRLLVDYKAICGDSSDNIKGVRGIGDKGAKSLIAEYGDLESIYASIDAIKPALRKKLVEGEEDAKQSFELARIMCDVPMDYDEELMLYPGLFRAETLVKLRELRFDSIIKRYEIEEGLQASGAMPVIDESLSEERSSELDALQQLKALKRFDAVKDAKDVEEAIDAWLQELESSSFVGMAALEADPSSDEIWIHLSQVEATHETMDEPGPWTKLNVQPDTTFVYDLSPTLIHCPPSEAQALIRQLLEHNVWLVGFDLKPLFRLIQMYPMDQTFDLRVASYLLGQPEGETKADHLAQALDPQITHYGSAHDELLEHHKAVLWAPAMMLLQAQQLIQRHLDYLAFGVEFPLVAILSQMEARGVKVDAQALKELEDEFDERTLELEASIYEAVGHAFNINSPKQLSEVLFDELGLPGGRKTASGSYSTAAEELEKLRPMHKVVDAILTYRQITKLNSTFVTGLAKEIDPSDGRVHTSYHQTLTATGRLSSSDPNLQNIPARLEEGRRIRKAFVPEDGYEFLDADYSQIELRLLAHLSEDEVMLQTFNEGGDIHRTTASSIFRVDEAEVTGEMRAAAKTVNFSIVYGISDFGLSRDLNIPVGEAHSYIEGYYAQYPGVQAFMQNAIDQAKEDGYVLTMFNRRREIPELLSKNYNMRQFGERVAMNSPVQGSAADIIKIAMVRTERALRASDLEAHLILQVHDELIIESEAKDSQAASQILQEAMEGAAALRTPLVAEVHAGLSWYDTKD